MSECSCYSSQDILSKVVLFLTVSLHNKDCIEPAAKSLPSLWKIKHVKQILSKFNLLSWCFYFLLLATSKLLYLTQVMTLEKKKLSKTLGGFVGGITGVLMIVSLTYL